MSRENLIDAFNFLDDDIINAVDEVRKNGKKISFDPVRWIPVAASLCILAAGVLIWSQLGMNAPELTERDRETGYVVDTEKEEVPAADEGAGSYVIAEGGAESAYSGESAEVPSVLIKVEKVEKDFLIGTVAGVVDTEALAIGESVTVFFEEQSSAPNYDTNLLETAEDIFDESYLEGKTVSVMFYDMKESSGTSAEDSGSRYTIYAESISLAEE